VDYIQREYKHIDLLLLDVMMPPGSKFDNGETRYGLRTGPRFFDFARSIIPMLPVVVFTNVTDEEVETYFQQQAHCWFLRKEEYFPRELAEFVQNALGAPVVGE
jgi:CheY-like chemotaxis protein